MSETPSRARHRRGRLRIGRVKAFVRYYIVGLSTAWGRLFDLLFIGAVLLAIGTLIVESVPVYAAAYGHILDVVEWCVVGVFIAEYAMRVWVARKKLRYIFSLWGLIDLLAIVPTFFAGFDLAYLRALRALRIFTILKFARFTHASDTLFHSLRNSTEKISVFVFVVAILMLVLSITEYTIEPQTFPTIPHALWWTVVTVTTVGYGDYVPVTVWGRILAGAAMVISFGIIAVPTGIVAAEFSQGRRRRLLCPRCSKSDHDVGARYCAACGVELPDVAAPPAHST